MPEPLVRVVHNPVKPGAKFSQQTLKDFQRQTTAGLTVGLAGHGLTEQPRHCRAGRVAMQNLKQKTLDRCHGIELSL